MKSFRLFAGRDGRVAAGLVIGEVCTAMQMLVVATIMPRIVADLRGLDAYGLAFGAFVAANFATVPFAGPLADRVGLRKVLTLALTTIAVGITCASFAQSMPQFVGARFIEGIGAGLDYAVSFAAIAKTFDEARRPAMFALISSAWVVPALVGPAAGAAVAAAFGWRAAFWMFLPLLGIAAILTIPALRDDASAEAADPFGSLRLLFSKATVALQRGMHASFAAFALMHAAFFGADAYISLMLVNARGLSLASAAACISLAAVGWSVASLFQPGLYERIGAPSTIGIGAAAGIAALACVIAVDAGAPPWIAFAGWCAGGAGVGLAYPTISLSVLSGAEKDSEGTASSAALLAAMLGTTTGVLLCGIPVTLAARGVLPLERALEITFSLALLPLAALLVMRGRVAAQTSEIVES